MSDHIHAMKELCNSFSNGKSNRLHSFCAADFFIAFLFLYDALFCPSSRIFIKNQDIISETNRSNRSSSTYPAYQQTP